LRTRYRGTIVLIAVGVLALGGGVFLPRLHAFGGPSATEIVQTIHEKEGIHRGTQEGVTPSLSPSAAPAMSDISAPPSIPPPSSTPSSSPFPTRREALDRQKVVVEIGATGEQYRIDAPVADTTYDLRSFTSTAYPSGSSFPLAFGPESPGARTVVIGGTVIGQQQRSLSWEDVHDPFGGGGLRMIGVDSLVSYDLRVNNVNDGFMPLPPPYDLNGARFLIDGCHMTWIRDDAVEDDTEMSGTIRNCLFKQKPEGRVRLSNVVVCYPENPMSPSRLRIFPPGHYSNVRIVLGSDFVGRYPGPRPAGVTVTRHWSVCETARANWLRRH
jgi:hypothetical protein